MKALKRVILISVLLLMTGGAVLLDPLVRFALDLRLARFAQAGAVYTARLDGSEKRREEADARLVAYVDDLLDRYYAREASYEDVGSVLSAMARTDLPQDHIAAVRQAVEQMEKARTDIARADALSVAGDWAQAIPLYRVSLAADEGAAFRLERTETLCRNAVLDRAEAAMAAHQYDEAETTLTEGLALFAADADLLTAWEDVHKLRADQTYHTWTEEARALLASQGPAAAFGYLEKLRTDAPDSYELIYLEQLIRHEYEADICARAQALRNGGDPEAACALLKEGLTWIDSEQMKALYAEARADITFWLVDMPVLRDQTADPMSSAESTAARDQVLYDACFNTYEHCFWEDTGSVTFALDEDMSIFAGTVAFPLGEKTTIYRASATLRVYVDGDLMAEFKNVDRDSSPLPFSLPVSGVRELTLTWTSDGANGWQNWGRFAAIFDGRFLTAAPA